ncbi:MAG: AmmeMemoRadiSam system protein B [Gammaproteobacteria bacterium]|nr:AmmeMemoRadiSam system protein B [Gammaproteobacteria bacterium]MCI0590192.1 AmmeMemoRadiSam system protein B [Gammaproteobacteria bacterium]
MNNIRPPAVSGSFYPDDPEALQRSVLRYLADAQVSVAVPKAIIAPHAGYMYSGPVAGSAYACLLPARDRIKRVILLGPAHRVYLRDLALSTADAFESPLGCVELDQGTIRTVLKSPLVQFMDAAHAGEHSLEVHLPFLQTVLDYFTLVPLVVGDAAPQEVSEVLKRVWGGEETLIVVSSDLSHYHDYHTANRIDRRTSQAIEGLRYEDIGSEQACGCRPVNGLLCLARELGLRATTLDLRNSGDTAGPHDRVVGYGAYALGCDEVA